MGRRALRRIDPELDLSGHLTTLEALAQPLDASALFGREAPLEIEVGSGKGLFLSAAAAGDPERNFLGIEILAKYARFIAARLVTREADQRPDHPRRRPAPVSRLAARRLGRGRARLLSRSLVESPAQKRRVMNATFLHNVQRVLCPAARCTSGPTSRSIFTRRWRSIAAETTLAGPHEVVEKPADHDLDYRTHFERRMRLNGEAVYRAEFRKA